MMITASASHATSSVAMFSDWHLVADVIDTIGLNEPVLPMRLETKGLITQLDRFIRNQPQAGKLRETAIDLRKIADWAERTGASSIQVQTTEIPEAPSAGILDYAALLAAA